MQQMTLWQAAPTTAPKRLTEREIVAQDITDIESCARLAVRDLLAGDWTLEQFQSEMFDLLQSAACILATQPSSWTVGLDYTIEMLQEAQAAALDGEPREALRATLGASTRTLPLYLD